MTIKRQDKGVQGNSFSAQRTAPSLKITACEDVRLERTRKLETAPAAAKVPAVKENP
jgi:hypothetical protein